MKWFISFMFFVSFPFVTRGQKELYIEIGNTVPDSIVFNNIINYKATKAYMADFKGKYILLDFWAPYCIPCVEDMPKIHELQKIFNTNFQIVQIGVGDEKPVKEFYERRIKQGKIITLPGVVGDTILYKMFKVNSLPNFVWIDNKGLVRGVTFNDQVTESNIKKFISNEPLKLNMKESYKDAYEYDHTAPFLINGNGGEGLNLIYHSVITGYTNIKTISKINFKSPDDSTTTRISAFNVDIESLYRIAYGDRKYYPFGFPFARVKLEVDDSSRYRQLPQDDYNKWKLQNAYCYEIQMPYEKAKDIYKIMRLDLDMIFGLKARIEKHLTRCLILTEGRNVKLQTGGSLPVKKYSTSGILIKSKPISELFELLQYYNQRRILIDETHYKGNIDINLECNMVDLNEVKNELSKYGLYLTEADRKIELLILGP